MCFGAQTGGRAERKLPHMNNISIFKTASPAATWSTSSFGSAADTSPMELAALGEHLRRCASARGALFPLKSAGEALGGFAAPRMITVIVLFTMLSIVASFVL